MAVRKCASKNCKVRISGDKGSPRWCPDCLDPLESGLKLPEFGPYTANEKRQLFKDASKIVMEQHKDVLQRLADYSEPVPSEWIEAPSQMTLPIDSAARKGYPLMSGLLNYFPAALAGVARTSQLGNEKHNPGQPLHHARGKSTDHGDCIIRHLMDLQDLIAVNKKDGPLLREAILSEASSLAWRALALSQELHEKFGAPLAPGAKND